MSDTRIENAIVEAIDIIAEKKVASANYDKTVIATIKEVVDKTLGKYQVKQQDSVYQAYSTNPNITYEKDQRVSVLISGNDRDRSKIIIGGVKSFATNYKSIPVASEQCNIIGPSGVSLNQVMQLSSYKDTEGEGINGNFSDIQRYVQQGNSILLGMTVRTSFASSQTGGRYGLNFYLKFKDEKGERITCYPLDSTSVIGNPYGLTKETPVQALFRDVDTKNFVGIDRIQAFCNGFPEDENKIDIKDIFISDIRINGAFALTQKQLSDMILHIDCSENGSQLKEGVPNVLLKAELKINGVVTTENVQYFWFRQNGLVFKGSVGKYSSHAGGGWECVNFFGGTSHIPYDTNQFTFTSTGDDFINKIALANQKVTKVLCVAVLEGKTQISRQIEILNTNLGDVEIVSSDLTDKKENQVNYYLGLGSPDLTCVVKDKNGNQITENLKYTWSVKPSRGNAVLKEEDSEFNERYAAAVQTWKQTEQEAALVPAADLDKFKTEKNYDNILKEYQAVINQDFVAGNTYYNFPINSIVGSTTISCAVEKVEESEDGQTSTYLGTASITLYNKTQLEGMYSLNMEYGTQVFQYDNKGNSPASKQVDKPITIHPLDFKLINNEGKQVTYQSIIFEGWVKWIIPTSQTLLKSAQEGEPQSGDTDITVNSADLPLPASDYQVYTNTPTFAYSIDDRYDSKKNVNYIWLVVKYQDIILSAYTNFTFPKDGDPGTNGTDIVAKITTQNGSDRLYIRSTSPNEIFDDTGAIVQQLDFQLYNNSIKTDSDASLWTCLANEKNVNTYLERGKINQKFTWQVPILKDIEEINIKKHKPVNIIRAQYNAENDLKYYAECPICTEFINTENQQYRIRIKPKTGFKYVVYAEDGTRPDYDNTLPFELILEEYVGEAYWIGIQAKDMPAITWDVIGNLEIIEIDNNKCEVKPKDNFDGSDLSSAVIADVEGIGFIHVPIYMIFNRYGHAALNDWDGNSIDLGDKNGGTILAPQVGAGKKNDESNTFTGVLMGVQHTPGDSISPSVEKVGLFGYHNGVRSIFLDADTGNATFGTEGAGQIKLIPGGTSTIANWTINQNTLQGGNILLNKDGYIDVNYSVDGKTGIRIDGRADQTNVIATGSGNFSVSQNNGFLTAKGGGSIASWNIGDNTLTSQTTGDNKITLNASNGSIYSGSHSTLGANNNGYYLGNDGISLGSAFNVTNKGYLTSTSGKIAGWSIGTDKDKNNLTNEDVGLGTFNTDITGVYPGDVIEEGGKVTAKIWSGSGTTPNFAVSNNGYIYSKAGKIGGWTIGSTSLTAKGITINSEGSINNGENWSIKSTGEATFKNATITGGKITLGNVTIDASTFSIENGDVYNYTIQQGSSSGSATIGNSTIGNSTLNAGTMSVNSGKQTYTLPKYIEDLAVGTLTAQLVNANGIKAHLITFVPADGQQGTQGAVSIDNQGINIALKGSLSVQSTGYIFANGKQGRSGTITFSDGSSIRIDKGIITKVTSKTSVVNYEED